MQIEHWTPQQIRINVNFSDPTIISKGMERDTLYMKIKNPEMFRSNETGLPIEVEDTIIKQTIPR